MMRHYYPAEAIRAAEAPLLAALPDGVLMRRAATGLAVAIAGELRRRTGGVAGRKVSAVIGSGDNGGDALWAAALLRRRGVAAEAILLNPDKAHAKGLRAFRAAGGRTVETISPTTDLVIVANSSKHPAVDKHTQQKAEEVAAAQIIAQGEAQIVGRLSASARKVLLVRDVPEWPFSPPTCNYRSYPDYKLCDRPLAELGGANRFPFGDYTASRNVAVLDLTDKLCPQGVCRTVIDGFAVTSDRHHLMPSFAATLSENFADVLKRYAGGGSQ